NILVTDVNVVPNTPTNLSPVDNALNQPLTLSLQASAFNDPNLGDSQAASQWLIQRVSDNSLVFDSGIDSADTTSLAVGPGLLDYFTAYSWQVRYQDNHGEWSPYSTATSFSTQPPALSVLRQGTNVLISWPTNNAGFALQYSADLSPNSWNAVTDEPALVIDQNVVTNQITNPATFFRLYKQ
ncbi:MAG TPA: hypothetical protein VFD66_06445, partial [Verrucomicrobiae bacterium]|nr:hypothetical protein [Verrucomicrobiae bacterium]